ncbi:ROK family protein [Mycoplasmatota bacterium]|nr:ROK family protein [Mycoplasmatota bacterium]
MIKVIGIDIGGTQIKGAIIDNSGNCNYITKVDTNTSQGREGLLNGLNQVIETLLSKNELVEGIGIGSAGRIDYINGVVYYATDNLPGWSGFHLQEYVEETYHLPTVVENDANAALIGEKWQGVGKGYKDIIMITLGTGVGGASILNDQLYQGSHFSATEYGHVILYPNGYPCNCGQSGCVEQYISGTALVKRVKKAGISINHGKELFDHIKQGNEKAKDVLNEYVNDIAITIHNINLSYDPKLVIIGGGVVDSKDEWWHLLQEKLSLNPQIQSDVKPAILGNKAGLYGASKLAIDRLTEGK